MTDFYNLVPGAPEGRCDGIKHPYSVEDVQRLRGSIAIKYTLAEMGATGCGSWSLKKIMSTLLVHYQAIRLCKWSAPV